MSKPNNTEKRNAYFVLFKRFIIFQNRVFNIFSFVFFVIYKIVLDLKNIGKGAYIYELAAILGRHAKPTTN
ncbi:MAG: hypothetical protein EAZ53_02525 [Bacteroidetes bacterium]|nr:MAG: hypothetical protein EAZ53_02525 [Bacteroidota bacterium]